MGSEKRFLLFGVLLFLVGGFLQWGHLRFRAGADMPISAQEGRGDLVKAGIYSLGSIRGLVATALWMEVIDAKHQRDYVRLKGNCDLLMEVQPKFTSTCKFLAYSEIYDLADQMPGTDEKYYWVRSGLNILDGGYRRNSRESALPESLGSHYNFRFSELRNDGAALAAKDAEAVRPGATDSDSPEWWLSDRHALSPAFRAPGDDKPRMSITTYLPTSTRILRTPRCVECFYWCIHYLTMAAQKVDANKQRVYTDIADAHKKLAWFSDWPLAQKHLQAAREGYEIMDADIQARNLEMTDAFRQNFSAEMFYLLVKALPRRARNAAEQQAIAAETAAQWAWYQGYFTAPRYPTGQGFASPEAAAEWFDREEARQVDDWNQFHPDDLKEFHEQLPR